MNNNTITITIIILISILTYQIIPYSSNQHQSLYKTIMSSITNTKLKRKVGIVGYGSLGKFLAIHYD